MNNRLTNKLLFSEQPLVIDVEFACLIGLNEAIVMQQIHYWLVHNKKENKNYNDGCYWTYNSIKKWQETNFKFWSVETVKRVFAKLEKMELLVSGNYNSDPRDKTKWYTINYDKLHDLSFEKAIEMSEHEV